MAASGSRFENFRSFIATRTAKGVLLAGLVMMGFLYVVQMNMTATKGYEIRELERSVTQLEKQAKVLKLQSLELQSMDRVMNQLASSRMVKGHPDAYVSPTSQAVASR